MTEEKRPHAQQVQIGALVAEDRKMAERVTQLFAAFSAEELDAALPLIFLGVAQSLPDVTLPPAALERIAAFMATLGIDAQTPPQAMVAAVAAHLEAAPSPVLAALERFLREERALGHDVGRAAALLLDTVQRKGVLQGGARPEGTIPAGPGARFAVRPPPKKP